MALPMPRGRLELLATLFDPVAEIIADYAGMAPETGSPPEAAAMLALLLRRKQLREQTEQ